MKNKLVILCTILTIVFAAAACKGPGGPATRAGRTIDHGAAAVGQGVERTGEKIQEVAR